MPAKKALAVLLCSLSKSSFGMLERIFGVSRSLAYRWIVEAAAKLPGPEAPGTIREMDLDEMWHFIGLEKTILIYLSVNTLKKRNRAVPWRKRMGIEPTHEAPHPVHRI